MAHVPLKVYVPEKTRQKCRIRAAQYGVNMSEFVERLIENSPEPDTETETDGGEAA
jgi:hypothetical protein